MWSQERKGMNGEKGRKSYRTGGDWREGKGEGTIEERRKNHGRGLGMEKEECHIERRKSGWKVEWKGLSC